MSICISLYPVFCVAAHRFSSLLSSHYNGIVLTATATDGLDLVLLLDLYYLIAARTYVNRKLCGTSTVRYMSSVSSKIRCMSPVYLSRMPTLRPLSTMYVSSHPVSLLPSSECREHVRQADTQTHTHVCVRVGIGIYMYTCSIILRAWTRLHMTDKLMHVDGCACMYVYWPRAHMNSVCQVVQRLVGRKCVCIFVILLCTLYVCDCVCIFVSLLSPMSSLWSRTRTHLQGAGADG